MISISDLVRLAGHARVSLLKIDVEGAEAVVFSGACDWLVPVDTLAIELHDDCMFGPSSEVFHRAIRNRGFEVVQTRELTIALRRGPRRAG